MELRKELATNDTQYQQLNKRVNQAKQEQKRYVLERFPQLESMPASESAAAAAQFRKTIAHEKEFVVLKKQQEDAEEALEQAFPELFITNEEIQARQREEREKLKGSPEFQKVIQDVSELVRKEMEYRHQKNPELKQLWTQIFVKEDS